MNGAQSESIARVTTRGEPLIVRTTKAPEFIGVPRSTFFVIAKRAEFPQQVVFGPRSKGYLRDELRAWVAAQRRPKP